MRIVSLSSVYPTPAAPGRGRFIHRRLLGLTAFAQVKVVAPVALFDYATRRRRMPEETRSWTDGPLEIFHPGWMYPPGGTVCNAVFLAAAIWRPLRELRSHFPFEIIDAHFGYPEALAAALLSRSFRVPFVVTLRGSELMHAGHFSRRRGMAWALCQAARVIAVSDELKRFAVGCGVPEAKVAVIPNGVSQAMFHIRDRRHIRRKLDIPQDSIVILNAGHLIRLKRQDRIIRACSALATSGISTKLVIAGGAGQGVSGVEHELKRLAGDLGLAADVAFLGEVPPVELAEWMCAADVFCSTSIREGWPNAIHEALACGTPVVATRVGAVPDLLPAAAFGITIPVDDQEALEDALREAVSKRWDRVAISRWAQSRSWDQVTAELFRELSEVLHERSLQPAN